MLYGKKMKVTIKYEVAEDSTGKGTVSLDEETVKTKSGTAQGSTASPASDQYVFGLLEHG